MPDAMMLGERAFTHDDQECFARLCGDFNPIHMDALRARRMLAGGVVVHGIHTLLWALDAWATYCRSVGKICDVSRLRVQFLNPLMLLDRAVCRLSPGHESCVRLDVVTSGKQLVTADIWPSASTSSPMPLPRKTGVTLPAIPVDLKFDDMSGCAGQWPLAKSDQLQELFPGIAAIPGVPWATFLAETSRLVGMECPGLHSLYSDLELEARPDATDSASPHFSYHVIKTDARFKLVRMAVAGAGLQGVVSAFVRPSPVGQLRMEDAMSALPRGCFVDQRALVIGGSRGLGELTAKLLAAGGADVHLTFRQGEAEAFSLVDEIRRCGARARASRVDVTTINDVLPLLAEGVGPTHLYYFATPHIFVGERTGFSQDVLETFCAVYVTAFARLVEALRRHGLTAVLYPSTVALNEYPVDMAEYCAAKAAGEAVCHVLMRRYRGLVAHSPRFPRLATDQTATLALAANADPLPHILQALRDLADEASCGDPISLQPLSDT